MHKAANKLESIESALAVFNEHPFALSVSVQIEDKSVRKAANKLESVESALREHSLANHPDLRSRLALIQRRQELEELIQVGGVELFLS